MNGCLVLVAGIAGVGKTRLCKRIARNWRYSKQIIHLDKDDTLIQYARIKGVSPEEILMNYNKERGFLYDTYYKMAEKELERGKCVLLDNPHVKELIHHSEWRERINNICERTGSKLVFIKCFIPSVREYRKRLERRGLSRDSHKMKDEESFKKFLEHEPLDFQAPKGSLSVDTSGKVDIQKVIEFIMNSKGIKL